MTKDDVVAEFNKGKNKEISVLKKVIDDMSALELAKKDLAQFEFNKSDILSEDKIDCLIKEKNLQKNEKYIYLFFADDVSGLAKEFNRAKNQEKCECHFAKFNKKNELNHCIYVGSSSDFSKRIAEHLGKASKSTYAIRFSEWLPEETKITCYYFKVDADQEVLQNLENGIWKQLKPMLGKFGAK
ncbi:MAG: GIY-YIG nuclease family protein [Chitinivibrionia bacterium]|nr:GIY-YIG nuclease family protein [Chitinivibrionia bacterium]